MNKLQEWSDRIGFCFSEAKTVAMHIYRVKKCGSDFCGEKLKEKRKLAYMAFMDLEKAYDTMGRDASWQVMRIYGI